MFESLTSNTQMETVSSISRFVLQFQIRSSISFRFVVPSVAISRFILQFQIRDLLFFNFEICCSSIIQLLLTAEQEAQQIVNAARTGLYFLNPSIFLICFDYLKISQISPLIEKIVVDLLSKLARLKQAKEKAEREVAEFRAQMEADYQRKLSENCKLPVATSFRFALHLIAAYMLFVFLQPWRLLPAELVLLVPSFADVLGAFAAGL
ncbi:hypothetical protein LXL04_034802 [Taraxacum kok-saghyz]